ncbi:hypothetical protein RN629_00980 [Sphingomonadaceae bacterium jetA1]|jgi:hypothetical protein
MIETPTPVYPPWWRLDPAKQNNEPPNRDDRPIVDGPPLGEGAAA